MGTEQNQVTFNVIPCSLISVEEVVKRLEQENGLTLIKKGKHVFVRYQADRETFERLHDTYQQKYGDIIAGVFENERRELPPFEHH